MEVELVQTGDGARRDGVLRLVAGPAPAAGGDADAAHAAVADGVADAAVADAAHAAVAEGVADAGVERSRVPPALARLLVAPGRADRLLHLRAVPARAGASRPWPEWAEPEVISGFRRAGIGVPWSHQVEVAEAAHRGGHVMIASGTASGKTVAYLLPALSAVVAGSRAVSGRDATVLYLAPTKALAADQLTTVEALGIPGVRPAPYDGDTPMDERRWARDHAGIVFTNPDMLHRTLLPGHRRWAPFLRALRFVVVDEAH
ncbi:MAG: DEAD/DEAH box helicase, partial [Kineosporiaceae bacterium]